MKLNLGCGNKPIEGYINIDIRGKVDIERDVLRGIPFNDETFEEVFSENFLEHIPQSEVIWLMNEIWRVTKPGGISKHFIPLAGTDNFNQDPTHLSHWCLDTIRYFTLGDPKNEYYDGAIKPWKVRYKTIVEPANHTIEVILEK